MTWPDAPIHFIDFEGNLTSGILEYGVVVLERGAIVATDTRLCAPKAQVRPADTAIHGLSERDLEDHAPFSDEFDRFAGWRERGPFAAHFAQAENSLIKGAWPYPRTSPDFSRPGSRITDWGPWLDTGRLFTQLFPSLPSARLEDLIASLGLNARLADLASKHTPAQRRHFHAALFDALAGALLLLHLLEQPALLNATLPWLLQMSTANAQKRAALQQDELF